MNFVWLFAHMLLLVECVRFDLSRWSVLLQTKPSGHSNHRYSVQANCKEFSDPVGGTFSNHCELMAVLLGYTDYSFALWYDDVNVVLNLTTTSRSERMKYRF
jgi:hypothetical protein